MIKPPNKIPDEILFRKLLEAPRPTKKINFRLNQAKEVPLIVRALSSIELSELNSDASVIVSSLTLLNGKPAFSSIDKITNIITIAEYDILIRLVLEVLNEISPTFLTSDYDAWFAKLKRGANHHSNWMAAHSLGSCFSPHMIGDKFLSLDEPEKYFGIPKNQLLDCHWMAFFAAKNLFQERNLS